MFASLARLPLCVSLLCAVGPAHSSVCHGTPSDGRLEGGVSLPLSGKNFQAYSVAGWTLGRTYVHRDVRAILVEAWAALEAATPGVVFVYGESGWPWGGRFPPHKTHRNGTSVDLMVPVLRAGKPAVLPANAANRFGYDVEFDDAGRAGSLAIDFEALAEQIHQLHVAAARRGVGMRRVIFEVPLQRHLWKTKRGPWLRKNVAFSTRQAWVRHDEHIHVDFAVECRRLR